MGNRIFQSRDDKLHHFYRDILQHNQCQNYEVNIFLNSLYPSNLLSICIVRHMDHKEIHFHIDNFRYKIHQIFQVDMLFKINNIKSHKSSHTISLVNKICTFVTKWPSKIFITFTNVWKHASAVFTRELTNWNTITAIWW